VKDVFENIAFVLGCVAQHSLFGLEHVMDKKTCLSTGTKPYKKGHTKKQGEIYVLV
jgi:hypothetical protein